MNINVMLVEDSPEYRDVIEIAINKETNMVLSGTFGAAEVALRSLQDPVQSTKPDIILLDLNLPGMSGLDAIPWIGKYAPAAKIIILTQSNREADVLQAISQGASGYLLKSSTVKQIKEGIRSIMNGNALLDGGVARYITDAIKTKSAKVPLEKPLSEREMEILTLLGDGLVKKEIANRLDISFGTVATHIRHIYEKLHVENAPAAISKAYKSGILPSGD
ncbi:response regulator transcription factor [Pontiellaceae bacterium B1224]|nr:response regulator transcription factor [Pontiellaceae bacterium B1224]